MKAIELFFKHLDSGNTTLVEGLVVAVLVIVIMGIIYKYAPSK